MDRPFFMGVNRLFGERGGMNDTVRPFPCISSMRGVSMIRLFLFVFSVLAAAGGHAQDRIYRCGNEYTNNANDAQARGCKLVDGGHVTVVQSPPRPSSAPVRVAAANPSAGTPRVDATDQRARDSDARGILESELRKAEARQNELLKEYNNGEPEKLGSESRNHQRYLDRVAELKASIARNDSDIAGIKRELGRLTGSK
jgi:hypothetical protein